MKYKSLASDAMLSVDLVQPNPGEMEFQLIVVFAAFAVIARAHPGSVVAPVAAPFAVAARLADSEFDPNPQYTFAYDVHDALTGDSKSQTESRNGGLVQGQYSVIDPDGTRRTVDYTADPVNGFNAIVSKAPLVRAVAAAPLVAKAAPVVAAAPVIARTAPLVASAPFVAAPAVARVAAPLAYAPGLAAAPLAAPYSIARVAYASPYAVY